ncbi:putative fatty acid elongation protein 3 [Orchesella cincta]|uniref:Elongation of very long chain fatty acids protein n=1 Tax=Orchesella cincta TaxID=48709 RepID=A0A1D2M1W4_ORCCI|nr:putative fatty acid elongation protein 3 [Orchesella cincta]
MEIMSRENWTKWEPEPVPSFPLYSFEKIDTDYWYRFAEENPLLHVQIVLIYLIALYVLRNFYMKDRDPLEIRPILFVWNLSMGLFSLFACYRMSLELILVLSWDQGFYKSICVREGLHMSSMFWGILYVWSKVFFLADTFFLVLLKKRIHPFHIVHHTLAVIIPPQIMPFGEPVVRWFSTVNFFVHAICYPILALQAAKVKIPNVGLITMMLELLQMVFALGISFYTVMVKYNGGDCVRHPWSLQLCNYMYIGFLLFVIHLCYQKFSGSKQKEL